MRRAVSSSDAARTHSPTDRVAARRAALEPAGITIDTSYGNWLLRFTVSGSPFSVMMNPQSGWCYAVGRAFQPDLPDLIEAINAGKIRLPDDAESQKCGTCHGQVWAVQRLLADWTGGKTRYTKSGKFDLLYVDGVKHVLTCCAVAVDQVAA